MKKKKWYNNYDFQLVFGIVVTLLYLWWIVHSKPFIFTEIKELKLNEFGDFCAGVFGPLMLLWLILGYLQQGRELKQNTNALMLQAEELKNTVEQNKELVKATYMGVETELQQLQMNKDRVLSETQPNFSIVKANLVSRSNSGWRWSFYVENSGKDAYDVRLKSEPVIKEFDTRKTIGCFGKKQTIDFNWLSRADIAAPEELKLIIDYSDASGTAHKKEFA